jgi:hypothetical protein
MNFYTSIFKNSKIGNISRFFGFVALFPAIKGCLQAFDV